MGLVFPLLAFGGAGTELVFFIVRPSINEIEVGWRIPPVSYGDSPKARDSLLAFDRSLESSPYILKPMPLTNKEDSKGKLPSTEGEQTDKLG